MGVAIGDLVTKKEVDIDFFKDKTIAIDAMNMLYQFVTTIRQADGTPLKDSKGNITSHLTGLFSRVTKLMSKNIKMVFVFDGKMPELKKLERERREDLKTKALHEFDLAKESNNIEEMKKLASRTTRISTNMIEEAVELISALGLPVVRAPCEGEAQASYMVSKGDCDYVSSQDYDCLIYGAPKVVRNLSLTLKRKKINALTYKTILPEVLELSIILKELELTRNQLIALSMIVGTDFNIGGIKGLGPKKGLKLVKEFGEDFEGLFTKIEFNKQFNIEWKDVFNTIKDMPVTDDYNIKWKKINSEKIIDILVNQHDFTLERVKNTLDELEKEQKSAKQTSLGKFF
jgi:flap endonuclease-1